MSATLSSQQLSTPVASQASISTAFAPRNERPSSRTAGTPETATRSRAASQVTRDAPISIADTSDPGYVSRGGHKLAGALAVFAPLGLTVAGRACLDAGASTGGFTDVLLRAGAGHVVAADVGYGQLAWSLRTDPRVTVLDRVNVRTLEQVTPVPGLVVADLSFISLTLVLPALVASAAPDADFVLLVKPQFEVGKGRVGAGGVVREVALAPIGRQCILHPGASSAAIVGKAASVSAWDAARKRREIAKRAASARWRS